MYDETTKIANSLKKIKNENESKMKIIERNKLFLSLLIEPKVKDFGCDFREYIFILNGYLQNNPIIMNNMSKMSTESQEISNFYESLETVLRNSGHFSNRRNSILSPKVDRKRKSISK